MTPSIYLNLEDDVAKITARIKREKADSLVLVCPKRCFLFNDSINLRLLKKQADLLKKEVYILTMDERGQAYAKEAGFQLKYLPKTRSSGNFSDVKFLKEKKPDVLQAEPEAEVNALTSTVNEIKQIAKLWGQTKDEEIQEPPIRKPAGHSKATRHNTKVTSPKVSVNDSIFPKEIEENHKIHQKKAFNQKAVTGLVAVSLIVILAVVFVVLPKATVVVYPKSEPVTRDIEVGLGAAVVTVDSGRLILPATKIDQVLEASNQFQSQGKKEVGNKATGTVQIYNFTKAPLNLKSATTVLTVGSKTYSLVSDVTQLKPTAYKNSRTKEIDENTLTAPIDVIASDGGDSFNLPAGTRLEITNQIFGSKPQLLYAKSATPFIGGTSRYLSLVSSQDITSSQAALEKQILQNIQGELNQNSQILPEKFYTIQDLQFATDKPVGTETPNFSAVLKARVTGLAFKMADLEKLISDRISQTLSSDKTLQANKAAFSYNLKSIDLNNGIASIDAHFEGDAVYTVNINDIASRLIGKTQNQVNEILRSDTAIERIDITLAPAWQKNFPWFAGKIKVVTGKTERMDQ